MRGSAKSRVKEQDGSEVGGEDLARNTLMCDLKLANLHPNLACKGSKIMFWEVHLGIIKC